MGYSDNHVKMSLRLPRELYERMRRLCHQRERSMHGLLTDLCREATDRELPVEAEK